MHVDSLKRLTVAAVFMAALSGCSISPTVDAASLTVGGFSYLLTGKGTMDHAVSAAAGQDCAMLRMVKNKRVCIPHDEDVVGDRLVFRFEDPAWTGGSADQTVDGDPLSVNPAIADMVQPLGPTVLVERRSTALAAVAADAIPIHAIAGAQRHDSRTSAFTGLVKSKPAMPMTSPDRPTRLWLPVK